MTTREPHSHRLLAAQVMRWCAFYTRQLPTDVASDRRSELASDLHEHTVWAQQSGIKARTLQLSILARAIRGAPADLSWRSAQRRQVSLANGISVGTRRADFSITAAASSAAALLVMWGLLVVAREFLSAARVGSSPWSETTLTLVVATVAAVLGLVLVIRSKTRALGALWLIAPTIILLPTGAMGLFFTSATMEALTLVVPNWTVATHLLAIGVALFFLAAAVWLWPSTTSAARKLSEKESL